jgi:hypothetical protein
MRFDRDEFALLSRAGRVPRTSRAGPRFAESRGKPASDHERKPGRVVAITRRRLRSLQALRAGVRATWTVFGEGQDR